ncbi:T9SS type A sorting domain-containing protein [uncultured Algibacter sp.]|uniref:T9SS type A sorting domain-containing protein n=1 Tax=uncultured Algibacter sp. TaxID=298659 RepID=UPI0026276F9E|nr:T9SS type A sorting domain-containing protein [uncultured Algibacter sp.]
MKNLKKGIFLIAISLFTNLTFSQDSLSVNYENWHNTETTFPEVFIFRNDTYLQKQSIETQNDFLEQVVGFGQNYGHSYTNSELEAKGSPIIPLREMQHRFLTAAPEKHILSHINGVAPVVHDYQDHQRKAKANYFPGHFAFKPGSILKQNSGRDKTTLKVSNTDVFSLKEYVYRKSGNPNIDIPSDILMVALDENGDRDWSKYEYLSLVSINEAEGNITVIRGCYGSTSVKFLKDQAILLPITGYSWSRNVYWRLNLSIDCPFDANGDQASDVFSDFIGQETVDLPSNISYTNGVALDIAAFFVKPEIDSNNDNIADGGYINGENRWRIGQNDFAKKLRTRLGDETIIISDGSLLRHQKSIDEFNGLELEGLVSNLDAYRGITNTINNYTYWQKFGRDKQFSFIADKVNPVPEADKSKFITLSHGMSTVLGVASGLIKSPDYIDYPYLLEGDINGDTGWLGLPVAPLKIAYSEENIMISIDSLMNSAVVGNGTLRTFSDGTTWTVKANDSGMSTEAALLDAEFPNVDVDKEEMPKEYTHLYLSGIDLSNEIILKMDLKAMAPVAGFDATSAVPTSVIGYLPESLNYDDIDNNKHYKEFLGIAGTKGYHTNLFYLRKNTEQNTTLKLSFEELKDMKIKNVEMITGPLVVFREFENGFVIVNNSEYDTEVNIDFEEESSCSFKDVTNDEFTNGASLAIPALTARFFKKEVGANCDEGIVTTEDNDWGIFPNPFSNSIYLISPISTTTDTQYNIYDQFSVLVVSGTVSSNSTAFNEVNLSHLNTGIYFLQIVKNDGSEIHKIIKN